MKRALVFAATALAAVFVVATAGADSIELPPGSVVTVVGRTAAIALSNNVRGTFNCACSGGKGACAVDTGGGDLACGVAKGDACTGSCRLSMGTAGLRDAIAAANARAASESHVPPAAH
jgi:hypothetical protein